MSRGRRTTGKAASSFWHLTNLAPDINCHIHPTNMGITASILTQIEIRSPPATVRAVFLDIQAHQAWQTNFIITPQSPASDPEPLAVGKKLNVQIGSATFNPVIQVG